MFSKLTRKHYYDNQKIAEIDFFIYSLFYPCIAQSVYFKNARQSLNDIHVFLVNFDMLHNIKHSGSVMTATYLSTVIRSIIRLAVCRRNPITEAPSLHI